MLLMPFITEQTGEVNSFLLHYLESSSVHREASWAAAARTGSRLGAPFCKSPPFRPVFHQRDQSTEPEPPGLPLSHLLALVFGLQVCRSKRRWRSLFHLPAAVLGRKEPGTIYNWPLWDAGLLPKTVNNLSLKPDAFRKKRWDQRHVASLKKTVSQNTVRYPKYCFCFKIQC